IAKPPHLVAICPSVTASNYHDGWTYQGGAFEQWFNESWSSGLAENTPVRRFDSLPKALDGMKTLPLTDYRIMKFDGSALAPYFFDCLVHPSFDYYWNQISIADHYAQVHLPVVTVAALHDNLLG